MRKSARQEALPKIDLRDFDDDLIVNTPLIAAVERAELPGPLKISNVCFVEKEERVRKQAEGGLVVVSDLGETSVALRMVVIDA